MPLYQLSVKCGQVWKPIGTPCRYAEACRWQNILAYSFKNETFKIERVRPERKVEIPVYLTNDFPVIVVI